MTVVAPALVTSRVSKLVASSFGRGLCWASRSPFCGCLRANRAAAPSAMKTARAVSVLRFMVGLGGRAFGLELLALAPRAPEAPAKEAEPDEGERHACDVDRLDRGGGRVFDLDRARAHGLGAHRRQRLVFHRPADGVE